MKKHFYFLLFLPFLLASLIWAALAFKKTPPEETAEPKKEISAPVFDNSEDSNSSSGLSESLPAEYHDSLLPDLRVEKTNSAYLEVGPAGTKKLRFPGTFSNIGYGPLELTAKHNKDAGTLDATQVIYEKNGDKIENLAGTFVLHPTHSHWHFENFVSFSLLSLQKNGSPGDELATTGKMTYCIHDYAPLAGDFPGKPKSIVYPWCTTSLSTQGISVGWADTYEADVSGQELDISAVPDGRYALKAVVDPENLLIEKNETNNAIITLIEIEKNNVRILDSLDP